MKHTDNPEPPCILMVVGDPSADLYGAHLVQEIWRRLPDARIRGVGGPSLRAAGAELFADSSHWGRMGVADAALAVHQVGRAYVRSKQILRRERPSLFIGIDWGTVNVRLIEYAHQWGVPTLYYIPPRSWDPTANGSQSWVPCADKVATPFRWSAERLRAAGADVTFVGHPVLETARPTRTRDAVRQSLNVPPDEQVVALLPGSRPVEIKYNLPVLLKTARRVQQQRPHIRFAIALAVTVPEEAVARQLRQHPVAGVEVLRSETFNLLHACDLALIASGTATLEAACLQTPMVIVYAAPWYFRAQAVFHKMPHAIGLPNIIAQEMIVPEVYGDHFNPQNLTRATLQLLDDDAARGTMRQRLQDVRKTLGTPGASARTADLVVELITRESPTTVVHHPT